MNITAAVERVARRAKDLVEEVEAPDPDLETIAFHIAKLEQFTAEIAGTLPDAARTVREIITLAQRAE
jgi:predicted metal-dependent hydrolase